MAKQEEYDEALKPYCAIAENALDRFFQSGNREDVVAFFRILDEMVASAKADALTDGLKAAAAIGCLEEKAHA